MDVTTVGLALAKHVFHVVGVDSLGRERVEKRLSRAPVLKYVANLPCCLIGMEACARAHYCARELAGLGHEVKLIPPGAAGKRPAAIGRVPRRHSSGGKHVLLGISKRGDRYLRSLLIHGARAVVHAAKHKDDRLSRRINRLRETRGINQATVALANKLARIGWAILGNGTRYQGA